jgi:hypothetical protein
MRNLTLITLLVVLVGGSPSLAQQTRALSSRAQPAPSIAAPGISLPSVGGVPRTMPALGARVPGTIPTPGAGVLGAIQGMPPTGASVAGAPVGSITTCTGAPAFSLDATSVMPFSGALATPPPPGATAPPNPAFGSSLAIGGCNPATATQDAIEALGAAATVAPTPGLATIDGPTYGDATVPATATQAGGGGLSPLIVVPSPCVPAATVTNPTTNPMSDLSAAVPTVPSSMMTLGPSVSPGC